MGMTMDLPDIFFKFWGKASKNNDEEWHPLIYHNLDVAAVAVCLFHRDTQMQNTFQAATGLGCEELCSLIAFGASIHDLGKFSRPFQSLKPRLAQRAGVEEWTSVYAPERDRHTILGLFLWKKLNNEVCDALGIDDPEILNPLAVLTFAHHGEPRDLDKPYAERGRFRGTYDAARDWVRCCIGFFLKGHADGFIPVESASQWNENQFVDVSWSWAGLMILSDWIGSNEEWFPYESEKLPFEVYWERACKQAENALRESGVLPADPAPLKGFSEIFGLLPAGASPYPMQQAVIDLPPQVGPELVILEDLTGGGKTESSLLVAQRVLNSGFASGLYVGLPTMATANAMYSRLGECYRKLFSDPTASLVASHGGQVLNKEFQKSICWTYSEAQQASQFEDDRPLCAAWLADNRKKSLLSPCGAGTLDQALLGILPARHQALRLYGIARSLLIADEVHAYDEYTSRLLERLLTFHAAYGGSAVLLSATLPKSLRRRFVEAWQAGRQHNGVEAVLGFPKEEAFPLMTRVTDSECLAFSVGATRRLDIAVEPTQTPAEMFETIVDCHQAGGCVCWIRNTVDDAVAARNILIDEYGIPPQYVNLFHARYAGCDRMEIEQRVLHLFGKESCEADRRGQILIATQVVEQSLDLDFDCVLSDLAPMELMIQRAGRCQRHPREERPKGYETPCMYVLMPQPTADADSTWYGALFEKGQYVYPNHAQLWRTAQLIDLKRRFVLPEDARELVEGVYSEECPEGLEDSEMEALGKKYSDCSAANFAALDFENGYTSGTMGMTWESDVRTPTRLGEESRDLCLVCLEAGEDPWLWAQKKGEPITVQCLMESTLRVNAKRVENCLPPKEFESDWTAFVGALPSFAQWSLCVPLRKNSLGHWSAQGLSLEGKEVEIHYGSDGLWFE